MRPARVHCRAGHVHPGPVRVEDSPDGGPQRPNNEWPPHRVHWRRRRRPQLVAFPSPKCPSHDKAKSHAGMPVRFGLARSVFQVRLGRAATASWLFAKRSGWTFAETRLKLPSRWRRTQDRRSGYGKYKWPLRFTVAYFSSFKPSAGRLGCRSLIFSFHVSFSECQTRTRRTFKFGASRTRKLAKGHASVR